MLNKFKITSYTQIFWIIAGSALLMCGFITHNTDDYHLVNIAPYIGGSMLAAGTLNILISTHNKKIIHGSHWLLSDGMTTALLSIFLIFNDMIMVSMIPFFMGIWELFSGIVKYIDAIDLRHEKIKVWPYLYAIGMIEIISGVAALLKPVEEFMGMHEVIAMVLFIQSASYFVKAMNYHNLIRTSS